MNYEILGSLGWNWFRGEPFTDLLMGCFRQIYEFHSDAIAGLIFPCNLANDFEVLPSSGNVELQQDLLSGWRRANYVDA